MNNTDNTEITKLLTICLSIMFFVLLILIVVYVVVKLKQRLNKKAPNGVGNNNNEDGFKKSSSVDKSYSKQSILDFMEFDDIKDNMIIQNDGKRFLMVIQCQGVNYDLMSSMEKVSVEEGFQQFLNTLRHPIQLYIQTRSINLESSINTYKKRLKDIEDKLRKLEFQYSQMQERGGYSKQQIEMIQYDIRRQRNLYEYGKDIINNTEKMNKNKNVLNKQYYVIVPYYPEEDDKYDKEEIQNMAFSELYTKSQAIVRTLSACSITGKILNSKELIELLYVAYNREESETYDIDKALMAGYNELYSTAPDVYEKKLRILDKQIEERANYIANQSLEKAKSVAQQQAEEREDDIEELATRLAKVLLANNEENVGKEITQMAIEEVDKKKGGTN